MIVHTICFYGKIWIIIPKLSLLPLRIWSAVSDLNSKMHMSLPDYKHVISNLDMYQSKNTFRRVLL